MNQSAKNNGRLFLILLLLASFTLSGCASTVIGVGSAAVAASTTEKGISTSVSDGMIFAKLHDKFIHTDASLSTAVDVTVNDGAVLLTGKLKKHLSKKSSRPSSHGKSKAFARLSMKYR